VQLTTDLCISIASECDALRAELSLCRDAQSLIYKYRLKLTKDIFPRLRNANRHVYVAALEESLRLLEDTQGAGARHEQLSSMLYMLNDDLVRVSEGLRGLVSAAERWTEVRTKQAKEAKLTASVSQVTPPAGRRDTSQAASWTNPRPQHAQRRSPDRESWSVTAARSSRDRPSTSSRARSPARERTPAEDVLRAVGQRYRNDTTLNGMCWVCVALGKPTVSARDSHAKEACPFMPEAISRGIAATLNAARR
jgi:hypothetical protein